MSSPSSSSRCCFLFPWMCDFCHVFFYFSHDIGVYSHCFYFSEPTENRFTREIISHRCHLKVLYLFMVLECVFHSFKIGFLFGMFGSGLLNTVFPEGWGFFFCLHFGGSGTVYLLCFLFVYLVVFILPTPDYFGEFRNDWFSLLEFRML